MSESTTQREVEDIIDEICKVHPAKCDLATIAEDYARALNHEARKLNIAHNFADDFNEHEFKMKVHEFVRQLL